MKISEAALVLETHLKELGLKFLTEYRFSPDRKWRFDYMLMDGKTALEIEGAVWIRGRHTRGGGYIADLEKYRTAAAMGFKVYRFATQEILDGTAKEFLARWVPRIGRQLHDTRNDRPGTK